MRYSLSAIVILSLSVTVYEIFSRIMCDLDLENWSRSYLNFNRKATCNFLWVGICNVCPIDHCLWDIHNWNNVWPRSWPLEWKRSNCKYDNQKDTWLPVLVIVIFTLSATVWELSHSKWPWSENGPRSNVNIAIESTNATFYVLAIAMFVLSVSIF